MGADAPSRPRQPGASRPPRRGRRSTPGSSRRPRSRRHIPIEPHAATEPVHRPLLDRRVVFVLGKGGVGRSTVAAALGVLAARRGQHAIVAEVSGRGDVPRLFGRVCESGIETELATGVWSLAIEPGVALEEYLRDQLPVRMIAEVIGSSTAFGYFAAATPGLRELLTVGKIWELAQEERRRSAARPYDVVIVDAPATGHGLALLAAPRTFADAAQVGPIARQAATIAAMLDDRARTAMVAVATPEPAALDELLDLRERLGRTLDAEIVNGVAAARFDAQDARRLRETRDGGRLGPGAQAALDVALAEHARAVAQSAELARLDSPIELPFIASAAFSPTELDTLADALARAI